MICKHCGKAHSEKYHLANKLNDKGFPTSSTKYNAAHKKANEAEKKRFPKGFKAMAKVDRSLAQKGELAGKNLKSGKIEVSKKVAPKLRSEVAFHEKVESKKLRKK